MPLYASPGTTSLSCSKHCVIFPISILPTEHGSLTITKANSSLRVSEAPCPDKLCEKQGPITGSGSIVCIPEGVIIEIITSKEGDSPDALLH